MPGDTRSSTFFQNASRYITRRETRSRYHPRQYRYFVDSYIYIFFFWSSFNLLKLSWRAFSEIYDYADASVSRSNDLGLNPKERWSQRVRALIIRVTLAEARPHKRSTSAYINGKTPLLTFARRLTWKEGPVGRSVALTRPPQFAREIDSRLYPLGLSILYGRRQVIRTWRRPPRR